MYEVKHIIWDFKNTLKFYCGLSNLNDSLLIIDSPQLSRSLYG